MTEAFQFKQFTIRHDRCAMKVGTDGVLLGAWANAKGKQRILDIRTGSGLIALMLAQRTDAMITGIEIDPASAAQAQENVAASPWADRLQIVATDIVGYTSYQAFDLIVSNPPFFNEMLLPPDAARSQARHTQALTFEALLFHVQRLLSPEGSFCAILPATALTHFSSAAAAQALFVVHTTFVHTTMRKAPKRVLVELRKEVSPIVEDSFVLTGADGRRSRAYEDLTKDYYVR